MIAGTFSNSILQIINLMGSSMNLTAPDGSARPIRAVITSIGKDDGDLINAASLEARVMYLLTLTPKPKKFDRAVLPNGDEHVIQEVHDILVNNAIVGHKCILSS